MFDGVLPIPDPLNKDPVLSPSSVFRVLLVRRYRGPMCPCPPFPFFAFFSFPFPGSSNCFAVSLLLVSLPESARCPIPFFSSFDSFACHSTAVLVYQAPSLLFFNDGSGIKFVCVPFLPAVALLNSFFAYGLLPSYAQGCKNQL